MKCGIYQCGIIFVSLFTLGIAFTYKQSTNLTGDFMAFAADRYPTEIIISAGQGNAPQTRPEVTEVKCPSLSRTLGPIRLESCNGRFYVGTSGHTKYMLLKSGGYGFFMTPVLVWLNHLLPAWTMKYHAYILSILIIWLMLLGFFLFFASAWSITAAVIATLVIAFEPAIGLALTFSALSELLVWTSFAWILVLLQRYDRSPKTAFLVIVFALMGFGMANKFTFVFLIPIVLCSGFFPSRVTKRQSLYAIAAFIIAMTPHLVFFYAFPDQYISSMISGITATRSNLITGNIIIFLKHTLISPMFFRPKSNPDMAIVLLRLVTVLGLGIYALLRGDRKAKILVAVSWGTAIAIIAVSFFILGYISYTRIFDLWPMVDILLILGAFVLWRDLRQSNMGHVNVIAVVLFLFMLLPGIIGDRFIFTVPGNGVGLPIDRYYIQQSLFSSLRNHNENQPLMVGYDTPLHFIYRGLLDYVSKGKVRPRYLKIEKAPSARDMANVLRRIAPKGPIRFIWLKPRQGLSFQNRETKTFADNLMRLPHRVLERFDKYDDSLIEIYADTKCNDPLIGDTGAK